MESFINQTAYIVTKDVATFLFTFVGLVIAGMGLATWKKQIKGVKEFDTAYNVHYSVLKLRDAIKYVRNPAIWPSESDRAIQYYKTKYPDETFEDIEKNPSSCVYQMRWEKIVVASTELESYLLEGEVLWGSEILSLVKDLNKKITELNIGLKQTFEPKLRTKKSEELDAIIYNQSNGNDLDPFSRDIEEIIKKISDYLKPKMM